MASEPPLCTRSLCDWSFLGVLSDPRANAGRRNVCNLFQKKHPRIRCPDLDHQSNYHPANFLRELPNWSVPPRHRIRSDAVPANAGVVVFHHPRDLVAIALRLDYCRYTLFHLWLLPD